MLNRVKYVSVFVFLLNFVPSSFSQSLQDSSFQRDHIKLDIATLYDMFFDTRFQLRAGVEYERYISSKSSMAYYLDFGLYDKYEFIKYYDFFGQNQGLYSVRQKVSTAGFHLLPSYNHYFFSFGKKQNLKLYVSGILDMSYYHKSVSVFNTLTSDESEYAYDQLKVGVGLGVGFKHYFHKHFFYELKTSVFGRLYNYVPDGRNPIKALDAQWASPNYNFWWITNLKIGYAF